MYLSGVVVVLVAVLVGLALLQYHWSAEVSRLVLEFLQKTRNASI